jgi:ubiquinone/menaquinone biosynthesis C-methylase UbiE
MSDIDAVAAHYSSGALWQRLQAALADDGIDTSALSAQTLAPYDQFHGRGLEATVDLADSLDVGPTDRLLDVGSGLGGPARYLADRFGCHVTGIDLTAEFCEVAEMLTTLTGMQDRVSIRQGSALAMPFDDASFDGAYSMNVSMNIEDKPALYGEIFRVLRPGGWLVLSEIAQGPNTGLAYPTPWARTERESFLVSPERTREMLQSAGFVVDEVTDATQASLDFAARARALVDQGHKPPARAVHLVHGELAATAMANSGVGLQEGQIVPIEVYCVRPD